MSKSKFLLGVLLVTASLSSCTTYYIPLDSFRQQLTVTDSTKLRDVTVRDPMNMIHHYKANPAAVINCVDKQGDSVQLITSPSIEMRVTHGQKKKKSIFYFDKTYVVGNSLIGTESRILGFIKQTIPLDSITKIEVQDGRKNYSYVDE